MKSQLTQTKAKISTVILGLAAALFLSVGCDDSTPEAQSAPSDHGHAH